MKMRTMILLVLGTLLQLNVQKLYAFEYSPLPIFYSPFESRLMSDVNQLYGLLYGVNLFFRVMDVYQLRQLKEKFPNRVVSFYDSLFRAYERHNKDEFDTLMKEIIDERSCEDLICYSALNKFHSYFDLNHLLFSVLIFFKLSTIDYVDNSSVFLKTIAAGSMVLSVAAFFLGRKHEAIKKLIEKKKTEFCINDVDEKEVVETTLVATSS